MKAFLTGLGIGAGLAIVLAPESGERTRGRLRELVSEWSDTVSTRWQGARNGTTDQEQRDETRDQSSHAAPQKDAKSSNGDLINSISKDELLNVHGIGPVLADRIISGRPYSSRRELLDRHVVSQNTFEELDRELGRRERRSA